MLYIVRKCDVQVAEVRRNQGSECEPRDYTWHVGNEVPCLVGGRLFTDVCEVQADGDELEYIRRRFKNIPDVSDLLVVQWKGDIAQFIYDHLKKE